jgi:uncharacterized protein YdeI (YjbR/CyaY-like superfamily)
MPGDETIKRLAGDDLERVVIATRADLHGWLEVHHGQSASVWIVTYKRSAGQSFVPHAEVLDELVSFGWIDGMTRKLNDDQTMQLIAPRRQQRWARTYQQRAERLAVEGRMQPSGQVAIDDAKKSGRWDELAHVDDLEAPGDLKVALRLHGSEQNFDAFPPSARRNILRWIATAKKPETRAKRLDEVATLAERRQRPKHL